MQEGQRERDVYLPKGDEWTNAWSGGSFEGGKWLKIEAALDEIPVFVRQSRGLGQFFASND